MPTISQKLHVSANLLELLVGALYDAVLRRTLRAIDIRRSSV
jgi:hypothetical protein